MVKQKSRLPDHVTAVISGVIDKLSELITPTDTPPDTPPKPAKPKNEDIRPAIELYCRIHFERFARSPYLTMADRMVLAKLHRELPDFAEVVTGYLYSTDPWIIKNGYAPRLIPSRVEAIRKAKLEMAESSAKEWK